jgi:hypothetical protein
MLRWLSRYIKRISVFGVGVELREPRAVPAGGSDAVAALGRYLLGLVRYVWLWALVGFLIGCSVAYSINQAQEEWLKRDPLARGLQEKPWALRKLDGCPWWAIALAFMGIGAGFKAVLFFAYPPTRCADCGAVLPDGMQPLVFPWVCDPCQRKRRDAALAQALLEQKRTRHDPIRFRCSACGKCLKIDGRHAGKKTPCPKCGVCIEIPRATSSDADDIPL